MKYVGGECCRYIAINRSNHYLYLNELFDPRGDEIEDPNRAFSAVAPTVDGRFYAVDLSEFKVMWLQ